MQELKKYNSFNIAARCKELVKINTLEDLISNISHHGVDFKIIGGGSNILITQDINYPVFINCIKGKEVIEESQSHVTIKLGSGENWHESVLWTLDNNFGGLENLSLIPGSIGAAPMQNIGAYGVEQCERFMHLEAYHIKTGEIHQFNKEACDFGYRESAFKNKYKDQYFILSVTYRLTKNNHTLNIDYGDIKKELDLHSIENPTIQDVSNAVCTIRRSKLPDPNIVGNAGSFFKNPVVKSEQLKTILKSFENVPFYPIDEEFVKIPAAWLIEKCGFKGFKEGDIGVHDKQALVLVNYGNGLGKDIYNLALKIKDCVKITFGIDIFPEVNVW